MFISASQGLEIMIFYFSFLFHFDHHSLGLKIIIPFLSPFSFFIVFSFLFFLPVAFSFFPPLPRKWFLVLGDCHQEFFLEPFSFLFILLCLCTTLVIVPSFAFKKGPGNCQKDFFFSNPFRFFAFIYSISFWLFPLP